jgi:hypothetical protein
MSERFELRIGTAPGAASRDLPESNGVSDREAANPLLGVEAAEARVGALAGESSATLEAAVDIPGLLALLPAFEDEIEAGERRLRECVRLLRAHRATWREIGDALQVSRQAAWERFRTS